MSTGGISGVNSPIYDGTNSANGVGNESGNASNNGADFSGVLSDALKEQAMQSMMTQMASAGGSNPGGMNTMFGGPNAMLGMLGGLGGIGGIGGIGGAGAMMGIENTLISAAGTGEMSGAQLMLFMMIMMMQSGDSGSSDMMPIMQMLVGLLTQSSKDATAGVQNNMLMLEDMQGGQQGDIRRMVDAALEQVGYRERNRDGSFGSGNITKFGAWYGMDGQPWCAMFVSWAADQAGLLHDVVPRHASTSMGVKAYQDKGLYALRGTGYMPQEGDAIYFQSANGRIQHVGIVVGVDLENNRVHTVEGNTNNAVQIRHYDLNSTRIHGYGKNGGTGLGRIPGNSTEGTGASTV